MGLAILILEGIRIDGVKKYPMGASQFLDRLRISGNIPGNVQRYCTGRLRQGMDYTYIINFFFQGTRFSTEGKTSKSSATCSQGPTGNRYLQVLYFLNLGLYLHALFSQLVA